MGSVCEGHYENIGRLHDLPSLLGMIGRKMHNSHRRLECCNGGNVQRAQWKNRQWSQGTGNSFMSGCGVQGVPKEDRHTWQRVDGVRPQYFRPGLSRQEARRA